MNLFNHFWCFKSALTPKFCDDVIKHALSKKENMGFTGPYDKKKNKLSKEDISTMHIKRKSDVVWLHDEAWIYKEIHPYINIANEQAGWNFDWHQSEACQFTKYKVNQHYDWHCDSWHKPYDRPGTNIHGLIRKLSVTCQLTDGSEYEGGELQFDVKDYEPHMRDEEKHLITAKEILPKGSIIVFPSFVWHRVKPVTKGTRYSLVLWNLGYPFR